MADCHTDPFLISLVKHSIIQNNILPSAKSYVAAWVSIKVVHHNLAQKHHLGQKDQNSKWQTEQVQFYILDTKQ